MPVGMEVTEDTPPDMLTGSMNLKLVLPSGKKIKTSVERSTPMMDLLVHVTTCHKLSPAAHVLQPYGERGILPYKPSTPIGALDTTMVHVIPKNQLTQNQSNKMALKQVSQPFEETYRIKVSLPRNQLYVLRANGRTTIADIHTEICEEKNLDPTKYSLRHPKELGTELTGEMTIAEYKSNQLVLVSNRSNPANQFSTDDIINAIQNINNNNNNNNMYAFCPSSRSLSPDSSMSPLPVQEPLKPLRKKKPPAPPPPPSNKKVSREKVDKGGVKESGAGPGRIISHSRTSSDSSGYHEASLLSESPPSNNSSLPDSLPRRSRLETKVKGSREHLGSSAGVASSVQQNQALSKSLIDLKAHHAETSASSSNAQQHSSLKPAQSTTSLHTARKKRAAPLPPPSALPPMKTVVEERLNGNSESSSETNEMTPTERSRTLEPERKPTLEPVEKCRTLPPGLTMSTTVDSQIREHVETVESSQSIPQVELPPLVPPDERDLVMEDEEIDRIFNNATAEHGNSIAQRSPLVEGNDSGRDSTDSNEVCKPLGIVQSSVDKSQDSVDNSKIIPDVLPSPVKSVSDETIMDWEYKLPAPPTFRDPPESPECSKKSDDSLNLTPRSAVISELSTIISQRSSSVSKIPDEIPPPINEEITHTSTLDNFKITTYTKNTRPSTNINSNVTVRRNNSVKDTERTVNDQSANPVKRSVSHVSLFVRPFDNSRSKTLDRAQDKTMGSSIGLRKTSSEFNIDSVGRRQERPQSYVETESLQSLQVLRSILPQLSRSQGSLNTIVETEAAPVVKLLPEPITVEKPTPRFEREEKVAVSLSTWGERPKRQVSIKSDRDYVFGQGGVAFGKKISTIENLQSQDSSPTNVNPPPVTSFVSAQPQKANIPEAISRKDSFKLIQDEVKSETNTLNEDTSQSDDDKKAKRIMNVYKSLDTGNTKPLRQILGDVSRVPVVRSVELKAPYKQDWQSRNTGLDKLKERFELDNNTNKETSPVKESDSFESTGKIRERFETAIKERYESTEKIFGRRDHLDSNTFKPRETTKININQTTFKNPEINNKTTESNQQHKYESKVKIDGNQTFVSSNNKTETKIELNDNKTPLNRYTSVIGIGGESDCEVRVRVKTTTGRSSIIPAQSLPPPDPRQQLLTSIRGFGLDGLKKVRS